MTISEISKKYDVSQDTLRYYESIGLMPEIKRKNGKRDYSEEDCRRIEFVKCMRGAGLTIGTLLKYFDLFNKGDETIAERKELLIEQRRTLMKKIEEMEETIKKLDYKINTYEQCVVKKEKELKVT
jgi:DNA-binding transcriptional MerR regulator